MTAPLIINFQIWTCLCHTDSCTQSERQTVAYVDAKIIDTQCSGSHGSWEIVSNNRYGERGAPTFPVDEQK